MIHPSYTELMQAINEGAELEDEPLVTSRYSVVLATSKRARQLIGGKEATVPSVAVEEFYKGKVHILPDEPEEAAEEEAALEDTTTEENI